MIKSIRHALCGLTIAIGATGALVSVAAHGEDPKRPSAESADAAAASQKQAGHATAEANKCTLQSPDPSLTPSRS